MPHLRERERERERESLLHHYSPKNLIFLKSLFIHQHYACFLVLQNLSHVVLVNGFHLVSKSFKNFKEIFLERESFFYVLAKKTIFSLSSLHKRTFFIDETLSLEHIYINKSFS